MGAEIRLASCATELYEAPQGIASPQRWERPRPLRVISVTSGKGGVGKSNVVVNLGLALALYPQSPASKSFVTIAQTLWETKPQPAIDGNIKFFWRRLL